jgi:hypothetical protein
MAEQFNALNDKHIEFIEQQKMFFVSTAGAEGLINLSPKGLDSLRIADGNTLYWLNLTGSGNETAAHVLENQRMTLMLTSFAKQPLILRIYGLAKMIQRRDVQWPELISNFPAHTAARQIFQLNIDMVQTSCGYAVPYYDFVGERQTLNNWETQRLWTESP